MADVSTAVPTKNKKLLDWVEEVAALTQPDAVHWCDGSAEEYDRLAQDLVDAGTFQKLSDAKRPNSYLGLSDPGDVARVEDRTFICSERRARRRPDQQLARPGGDARDADRPVPRLHARPHDVRRPVLDGPAGLAHRPHRRRADRLALRGGEHADHDPHGPGGARRAGRRRRLRALPALGRRAAGRRARRTCPGRATPTTSTSSTSPRRARSGRYGSGYGGNALLGKKCFALRIASVMARDEGWMAEHMLILKLTSPDGDASTSPARSRARAARPTSPCSSRPSRAGRSRPSATTSPG